MRVLTFLHSFEPGGVERIALRLVREWRRQGADAPLFMGRTSGAMRAELAGDLSFGTPRQPPFSTGPFETLWMIASLPAVIRRQRPDALFCAGNSYAVVAVAMKLLLGRRCPPVLAKISNDLDRRDMAWPVRLGYRLWLRIQGRFIDAFVGMAEPMRAEIGETVRPASGRIAIIHDPALSDAQIDRLRAMPRRPNDRAGGVRFVSVVRLAAQKNVALMIRAFAQGAGPDDSLVIFGEGAERPALSRLIARLGLKDRVTLAGHVADPAGRLAAFDVFLLSSEYEGVPAVLLEAMAAGLSVITTDCSRSIRSMLGDGAFARIVAPGDEAALADAIGGARHLPRDVEASLRQARAFTIERAAPIYIEAFSELCGRSSAKKYSRHQLRGEDPRAV
jgi:glycosyltransferase involved in cell wall biosynthesis